MGVSMISDHTKLVLGLTDSFDYKGYVSACLDNKLIPQIQANFYQLAGLLEGAKRNNADNPIQAYLEIIAEQNDDFKNRAMALNRDLVAGHKVVGQNQPSTCSGCGGGKTR